jgi:hypothetical protein
LRPELQDDILDYLEAADSNRPDDDKLLFRSPPHKEIDGE